MKSISCVLFFVLICSGVVFSKNLDERNFYDIEDGNSQHFGSNSDNLQYEIVYTKDRAILEETFVQNHPKIAGQPTKKKITTTERGLCVGSVMLMALCY